MSPVRQEKLVLCNAPLVGGSMDITPDQLKGIVDASADAGFAGVSLWAFHHNGAVAAGKSPAEVKAWHDDRGLSVPIVESLIGWEGADKDSIEQMCIPTLDVATLYGATDVAGVVMAPELPSMDAAQQGLGMLGELAADRGLRICIEWLPWSALPTIEKAWGLIEAVGQDHIGLVVDAWHWLRQPGGPDFETLRKVPGDRIHCVQLDDAPLEGSGEDQMTESMTNRLLPGDGDVEWAPLLAALEEMGADPIWAPEVFNLGLMAEGPVSMAQKINQSTRKVLGL